MSTRARVLCLLSVSLALACTQARKPEAWPEPKKAPEAAPEKVTEKDGRDQGVEEGVDLGVEGGVPGGVVGGVVGGLPGPVRLGVAPMLRQNEAFNTEGYNHIAESGFHRVDTTPLSTFAIDVDTASYANVRRFLAQGTLPPADAVRVEELINYFRYDYPEPAEGEPFSIATSAAACPWQPDHLLVSVGLRARSIAHHDVPPRNLVFLIDVSGSMDQPDKLPLLKSGMGLLVDNLRPEDRVAIVVYAGSAGLVLPSTGGSQKGAIRQALGALEAGGSTAGGAGLQLAYRVAKGAFIPGGVNRVVLATDGDFNVGVSSEGELVRMIEEKRKSGIALSVLGFGQGNLQDSRMEQLADHGNGNYAYIDTLAEARKVLVEEVGGTLVTVAKDVKIQVEFNPAAVAAYRLVGYENRALAAEDFNDDGKDAGEMGSGHNVTALYEIVPRGASVPAARVDPLKYQPSQAAAASASGELLTVKARWKEPEADRSQLKSVAVSAPAAGAEASPELRFASAVAEFGLLLRHSEHRGRASWSHVVEMAQGAIGEDRNGYRHEFLDLATRAANLSPVQVSEK